MHLFFSTIRPRPGQLRSGLHGSARYSVGKPKVAHSASSPRHVESPNGGASPCWSARRTTPIRSERVFRLAPVQLDTESGSLPLRTVSCRCCSPPDEAVTKAGRPVLRPSSFSSPASSSTSATTRLSNMQAQRCVCEPSCPRALASSSSSGHLY